MSAQSRHAELAKAYERLQEANRKDAQRIVETVNRMVNRLRKLDSRQAEFAEAYWAAHIKQSLGDAYGGAKLL